MSDPLVDLLLVRLGGDEEKKKVTRLLVTELDMTVGEAEKAVENSPVVIRESVGIGEARIIQKSLYPYIDLLPRLEEDQASTLKEKIRFVSSPSENDDFSVDVEELEEDEEEEEGGQATPPSRAPALDADEDMEEDEEEEEEEGGFNLTTASDEMLAIERCHICGKTPMGGEKLAPCRTCGDLTCRDCFDRAAHVCHKCAADGHTVDRPVASKAPGGRKGAPAALKTTEGRAEPKRSSLVKRLAVFLSVAVALLLFYFLDPLNLFGGAESPVAETPETPDSSLVVNDGTADTLATAPDSLAELTVPDPDPIGILALSLPDSASGRGATPSVIPFTAVPSACGASSATDELTTILPQIEILARDCEIAVDRAALLVYGDPGKTDHLSVLVLAVNHPVNNETRFAFLAATAAWLIPGGIDQLVLCYRETRFHQPQVYSYTSLNYQGISGAMSPNVFMDLASTHDSVWESISGPVAEWICGE